MDENKPIRIVLVGAGHVAWHLGHAFSDVGMQVVRIINRTFKKAQDLANELKIKAASDFRETIPESDFIIVAVKDSALKNVLQLIQPPDTIVLHTSGSHGLDVFPPGIEKYGVFYPFQSLTRGFKTDFSKVPLCIEASDEKTLSAIKELADKLSSTVRILPSEQRRKLHLCGIIGNNFTNHLIALTFDYMKKNNLEKELIIPLLNETLRKLDKLDPAVSQTGPARRNDRVIVQKHIELLEQEPELKKLYGWLTDSIIAFY